MHLQGTQKEHEGVQEGPEPPNLGSMKKGVFLTNGWGPMKGALSAQKAFQGSKTGTRQLLGGTEEKVFTIWQVITLPSRQNNYFSHTAPLCLILYALPDFS